MPLIDEFTKKSLIAEDFLGASGFTGIGVAGQAAQSVGRNTELDSEIARHRLILLYISFQRRTDDENNVRPPS